MKTLTLAITAIILSLGANAHAAGLYQKCYDDASNMAESAIGSFPKVIDTSVVRVEDGENAVEVTVQAEFESGKTRNFLVAIPAFLAAGRCELGGKPVIER